MAAAGLIATGLIAATLLLFSKPATALAYFDKGTVPRTFAVGTRYPNYPETTVCRRLQTYISRDSDRFREEMVTNTDPTITFANSDARIMSSRMQSKLGLLKKTFTGSFTVIKGWVNYPDPDLTGDPGSLHYEGRSIRVRVGDSRRISEFLRIAASDVGFDWVEYTSSQYVRLTVIPNACLRNADVVFILDSSGSIGATNFKKVIKFLNDVTSYFSIAPNATRVGMVKYSTVSTKVFSLNSYTTAQSLQAAINRVTYSDGWTATGLGLLDGLELLNASNPTYGTRPLSLGLPRTAILITDGYSNRGPSVASVAPMLRNAGINVYAVGVGKSIRESELEQIANSPAAQYVYGINSYDDAEGFVNLLSYTACDTPACVNPADDISGTVIGDDITYYCSMCREFSRRVIVYVKDVVGKCHLYGSGKDTNPGPLTDSTALRKNESIDRDSRWLIVDVDTTSKTVYVGVKGYRTRSIFSMFISDTLFGSMEYSISINDSFTRGSAVFNASANLVTQIRSNTLRYSISSGNGNRDFSIDPLTGVVRVNGTLNAITKPSYVLVIVAQNFTTNCHRARLDLVITVRRSALVGTTAAARIRENAPVGTPVALVSVIGGNGNIAFSFDAGSSSAFAINSSGWITVRAGLDYETQQNYSLTVRITSMITRATSTVVQLILVTDVNEAPFFILCAATSSCVGQVYENSPIRSSANVTVTAADPDFSYLANGMFAYALQSGYPFTASSAGVIATSEVLDRENVASYTFTVTVTDRGTPPLSAVTSVRVVVLDVNDNPPIISGSTYLEAREDASIGTTLATYTATDADIGINAVIQFVLVSSASLPFSIDVNSGTLALRSTLSLQNAPSYNFRVVARNPDGLNGTRSYVNVTVKIIGVNSHAPLFVGAPYLTSVVENSAVGAVVNVSIRATDADSGTNGIVRYAIVQGNAFNSFSLNTTTGQLKVSTNIDREVIDRFYLVVRAYDLGFPSLSATATVNVTVIDVNDNAPVFNPPAYAVTVRESIAVGSALVTVSATDKDQPGNPNSQFDYSIANPMFSISPNGSIRLAAPLNFSVASSYRLVIVATDRGVPPMNGTAPFMVTVLNDHPAVISGNRTVSILETAPPQSFVIAYAPPGDGQFSILSGNVGSTFSINSPSSGDVLLVQPLDFNTRSQYVLAIGFTDTSTGTLSTSYLTVIVVEVNKFAPVFHNPLSFFVQEELPAGTLLGFINVTDADKGPLTSKVTLTFLQGPLSPFFVLNSTTGRLTTSMQLDREALEGFFIPPSSVGTATILAQDSGTPPMQTLATIAIELGDINDNYPNITDTTSTVSIVEEAPFPALIFDITATDEDLGLNGTVQYWYVTTVGTAAAAGRFAFPDNATGMFSAIGRLDREQQEQYVFTMLAYDLGTPFRRTTTVSRNLMILDINDNAPTFPQSVYRIKLSDSVVWTNVIFITVVATDPDKGLNGTVLYELAQDLFFSPENPIEPALLAINSVSGGVTVSTTFSFSFQPQINATITATDLGTPPMSSSVLLIVDITSSPKFPLACGGSVYENSPIGTPVTSCAASAQGSSPPIAYSIQSAITNRGSNGSAWASLFQVDINSGNISVAAPIDREAFYDSTDSDTLILVIAANDSFNIPSTAQVRITILDVNDNAPIFQSALYSTVLSDSAIAAYTTNVFTVTATDRDEGANALVMYSVIAQDQSADDDATNVTIFAQDSAPLGQQLNSSAIVMVTFQSECHIQAYSVDQFSGQITATLLCSASVSPTAANVTLGGSLAILCTILANTPQTYQWIQNGTAFTDPQIGGNQVSLSVANATYSSAGEYGCKVTTAAGSLQSGLSAITIQVPPIITVPPTSVAIQLGMAAQFTCVAIGTPSPSISWLKNGVPFQQNTNTIQLDSTQLGDQAVYSCVASNNAGTMQASANLTFIDTTNVVGALVNNVTNPGNGGTCQQFDITTFQTIISNATGLAVIPTNISGSLLCDMTPCISSPCLNGGTCMPSNSSTGGYTCTCPAGFTGSNCDQPINFCLPTNPCSNGAICTSQAGSYTCTCPPGTTGALCQLIDACDAQPCSITEVCIPVSSLPSGYACELATGLEGTLLTVVPQGLGALIRLDNSLAAFALAPSASSGKRRQAATQDPALLQCEGQFIHLSDTPDSSLSLVWICPSGVQPPTNATLGSICQVLLQLKVVTSCYSPSTGNQYVAPPPTLVGVDVGINFVLLSASGFPLSSQEALSILVSSGALTQLQQNGFKASSFVPLVSTSSSPSSGPGEISTGAAVGIAVGAVVGGLVLAAIIIFIVSLLFITKRRKEAIQMAKQNDGGYVIKLADMKSGSMKRAADSQDNLVNNDGNEHDTSQHTTRYELSSPPLVPPKPVETPFIQDRESKIYENVVKPN